MKEQTSHVLVVRPVQNNAAQSIKSQIYEEHCLFARHPKTLVENSYVPIISPTPFKTEISSSKSLMIKQILYIGKVHKYTVLLCVNWHT